jgi:hypothetical protein
MYMERCVAPASAGIVRAFFWRDAVRGRPGGLPLEALASLRGFNRGGAAVCPPVVVARALWTMGRSFGRIWVGCI